MPFGGELAALGTSLCFSLSSIFLTLSGRELGSLTVNRVRLLVAVLIVILLHMLTFGSLVPVGAETGRWFWLGLSGFVGLALGDAFLVQAFVLIGPRLAMLMMALAPVLSALFAWLFLGETLTTLEIIGIGITVGGIMLVLAARRGSPQVETTDHRRFMLGLVCGLGAATGQAGGLVLSKIGLRGGFPALSGNLIRLLIALLVVWALEIANRRLIGNYQTLRAHPQAVRFVAVGAILGPVLGVWLSLVALQNAPVGIVSTLSSLMPIFLIPISYIAFGERVNKSAVLGTLITITGMIVLFLS